LRKAARKKSGRIDGESGKVLASIKDILEVSGIIVLCVKSTRIEDNVEVFRKIWKAARI
jgi:hypothetical protein